MPSGRLKSPIPLDSASDAEDAHPVDAVIQAAISRQQSPGPGVGFSGRAGKRKRAGSPLPEPVLRHASSDLGSLDSGDNTAKQDPTSPSASKSIPAAGVAPIGVTVVEEGAQTRNAEVQRLLRGGRQVPHLESAVNEAWLSRQHAAAIQSPDRCAGLSGYMLLC